MQNVVAVSSLSHQRFGSSFTSESILGDATLNGNNDNEEQQRRIDIWRSQGGQSSKLLREEDEYDHSEVEEFSAEHHLENQLDKKAVVVTIGEWNEYFDEEIGASYYYNSATGEATWVDPADDGDKREGM